MGGSDSKVDSSESSKQKEGGGSEENKYGECSCQVVFADPRASFTLRIQWVVCFGSTLK